MLQFRKISSTTFPLFIISFMILTYKAVAKVMLYDYLLFVFTRKGVSHKFPNFMGKGN